VDAITATDQVTATGFTGTLDGILGSGTAAAASVTTLTTSDVISVDDTTDSTSGTSGSIHTDGGLGIAKSLHVVGTTTHGGNVVSDTDSTDDLGTTGVRWANLFVDAITATDQITATGFTGTLDGILGSGTPAAATVTTIDASSVATAATFEPDGDTSAADNAAIGYTSDEGLILTGQGAVTDVTVKNDADATVVSIPTGTTTVSIGSGSGVGHISSNGTNDLKLSTNSDTNSGNITITDGADEAITLTPNGAGVVDVQGSMNSSISSTGKSLVFGF
jgi:hypothetical protein